MDLRSIVRLSPLLASHIPYGSELDRVAQPRVAPHVPQGSEVYRLAQHPFWCLIVRMDYSLRSKDWPTQGQLDGSNAEDKTRAE